MGFTRITLGIFASILATALFTSAASAQTQRLRGEIVSVDGATITVKTNDSKTMKVTLADGYTVNHAVVVKLADVKPGTYMGIGAVADGDGMKAAQVQIFPPNATARERHGEWSSDQSGTMTNAPVTAVVVGQSDGMLTLTTGGKNYDIKVPADVPVMKTQAGTKELIKTGAWVSISNAAEENGMLTTKAITVSDDRRYPAR